MRQHEKHQDRDAQQRRDHQQDAVDDVAEAFEDEDRG
jgi:predicted helicase